MQFHLDGFIPGEPHGTLASPLAALNPDTLPTEVDVLIVGCGPTG